MRCAQNRFKAWAFDGVVATRGLLRRLEKWMNLDQEPGPANYMALGTGCMTC
eukprot:CAMPEP_0174367340 /NCGR_PEP_ID=MMETSP0811_2-20130205/84864_1 /TAXON_ID=73025 ORGANISM="Eutreptiella gymnastica-like, Strain CCMP1594" /NCGR_SAMPLE_ID=MMETSP0811_2 /ASSEMBLY_ACC=CAM_ASM_000667 /LENGTH=51 /DNA_ID=CAMNT_0015509805 /DNA_START=188 /DNA_END=340 /DNA_ORIENTATION=-